MAKTELNETLIGKIGACFLTTARGVDSYTRIVLCDYKQLILGLKEILKKVTSKQKEAIYKFLESKIAIPITELRKAVESSDLEVAAERLNILKQQVIKKTAQKIRVLEERGPFDIAVEDALKKTIKGG
jgi:hypothetical protein